MTGEEKWAVVIWKYGFHCDEFIVEEVRGPFDFDRAREVECEVEAATEYYAKVAPMDSGGEVHYDGRGAKLPGEGEDAMSEGA